MPYFPVSQTLHEFFMNVSFLNLLYVDHGNLTAWASGDSYDSRQKSYKMTLTHMQCVLKVD